MAKTENGHGKGVFYRILVLSTWDNLSLKYSSALSN